MLKILIIDGNDEHRSFLKDIFNEENFILDELDFDKEIDVYEAKTAFSGIKLAQVHEPNLILLEVKLPDMNGLDVCKKIREIKTELDIPIIFLTAINDMKIKEEALKIGASDYINKPANPYEILIKIKNHLDFYNTKKKLKQSLENYEKDLRIARKVQLNLLPKIKKINNINFDYIYISSHSTSGDMFDVIPLEKDKVFAYIYDVSGHGVTSALLSVIIKQEIENIYRIHHINNLKEFVLTLEKNTREYFFDGMYFTGVFSIISKNYIEYVNLAHREVIFLGENRIKYDLKTNFPLGVGLLNENNIDVYNKKINKDEYIIFYTDGIYDIKDNFKETDFYNILVSGKFENPKDISRKIKNSINEMLDGKFPNDDITMVVLKQEEKL